MLSGLTNPQILGVCLSVCLCVPYVACVGLDERGVGALSVGGFVLVRHNDAMAAERQTFHSF